MYSVVVVAIALVEIHHLVWSEDEDSVLPLRIPWLEIPEGLMDFPICTTVMGLDSSVTTTLYE